MFLFSVNVGNADGFVNQLYLKDDALNKVTFYSAQPLGLENSIRHRVIYVAFRLCMWWGRRLHNVCNIEVEVDV